MLRRSPQKRMESIAELRRGHGPRGMGVAHVLDAAPGHRLASTGVGEQAHRLPG